MVLFPRMGKKRSKRTFSSQSGTLNETSSSVSSFDQGHSAIGSDQVSGHFKVQLLHDVENKAEYAKWTKNCYWKNIAFIRSSALRDFDCQSYVFIRGTSNCAAFCIQPLKSVKNGCIVLLNAMGFHSEEHVTLHSLPEVCEAEKIICETHSYLPSHLLLDIITKKLSNRFIWCGLKLQFSVFDVKSECIVKTVQQSEKSSKSSHLLNESSDMSFNFSKLSLQESPAVDCFTMNHRSSVVVSAPEGRPDFPLFQHLGGCHQQIETIRNCIETFLESEEDCGHLLLLSGPSKSAKNTTIDAICNEYSKMYPLRINALSLNLKNTLEETKCVMKDTTKGFLVLDKLDLFCLLKTKEQISNLFHQLNEICENSILIIAALSSELIMDKQLLNLFSVQEVTFTLPNTFDREEIIQKILMKQELSSSHIKHFADLLQGLKSGEIFRILKFDAPLLSLIRKKNSEFSESDVSVYDIETSIKKRKSYSSNLKANQVRWSDIGGMEAVKRELMEELEFLTHTSKEKLKQFNYSPTQGILMYGPPGCSKTMIAKALATECNWNFISKKASDIMNMYVGESEKAIANLFLEARLRAPCIIFLDEIDAIAPSRSRSASASGVQNRVVNCLLTEMAGLEALKDVLVIAATNRPDIIDDALLRRGRIGKLVYVPLPDPQTRKELFRLCMKRRQFSDDIDFDDLVERTEGYTGAEVVQLCNEAAMKLLIENPNCSQSPVIKKEHFEHALLTVLPLTQKDTITFYEQFHSKNSKRTSL